MRLSISNIAWDPAEDEAVAALLSDRGVDAIDVAPGKYFPDPALVDEHEVQAVRRWWRDRGFEITGMQSLLFGTRGLNLFGDADSRAAMLERLEAVCRVGAGLGAGRLVFGSPKNRDRGHLDDEEALESSVSFFRRLGDAAERLGVVVCLEPNPERYGANFMTTAAETAQVVRAVSHPAIRLQLDTGALLINGEDVEEHLREHADLVGHVHASDPDLVPLGDGTDGHPRAAGIVRRHLPHHVVTVEMVATVNEPHPVSISRALEVADRTYGRADT